MTTDYLTFLVPLAIVALGLWAMYRLGYRAGRHDAGREIRRTYRAQSILHML